MKAQVATVLRVAAVLGSVVGLMAASNAMGHEAERQRYSSTVDYIKDTGDAYCRFLSGMRK